MQRERITANGTGSLMFTNDANSNIHETKFRALIADQIQSTAAKVIVWCHTTQGDNDKLNQGLLEAKKCNNLTGWTSFTVCETVSRETH